MSSLQDMTTWERALYQGQELALAQQRQLESLVSTTTGQPIPGTTPAHTVGYGLGVQQATPPSIGPVWDYEGETYGCRVVHLYFPRSGIIIALAASSDLGNSGLGYVNGDLATLAVSVYQALQEAGAAQGR